MTRPLGKIAETTPRECAIGTTALVAILLSLVTMFLLESSIIIVAGFFSILVSMYSVWQQRRLTDITTLQETYEATKHEVDRLAAQNTRLQGNIHHLSDNVDKLTQLEDAFRQISDVHGNSVAQFADQVQESRENLSQMERNVKYEVAQNLLTVIMSSDSDGDTDIDSSEVDELLRRLRSIYGTKLDEHKVREAITQDGNASFDSVYSFIQDVLVCGSFPNEGEERRGDAVS